MSYLLSSPRTGESWLIDPVLEHLEGYLRLIESRKLKLAFVIDTHTHADHLSASPALAELANCSYLMHSAATPRCVNERIVDGTVIKLDDTAVQFIHTPGHTQDSMCVVLEGRILTGDTLFLDIGGAGRVDLPGGDAGEHWESLQRLTMLSDQLLVHPGHEYRNRTTTTLAVQRQRNPVFRPRTKPEYLRFLEQLHLGPADWMKQVLEANAACTKDPDCVRIPRGVAACEMPGTLASCGSEEQPVTISVDELKNRLAGSDPPVLVDVRESSELVGELGHLPGIKHIPVGMISERVGELEDFRGQPIVMICKVGGRALNAGRVLVAAGFPNVTVLTGGMTAWRRDLAE